MENENKEYILRVYGALQEKGYNAVGQIVGYLLTEDPTYIIEAHSVRIAELMKNHEHGILTTTTDKLLVDFATEVTKRVNSDYLKKEYQPQAECVPLPQVRTIPRRRFRPVCLLHGHPTG